MPGIHAKYSPSHAAIWGTCTASVGLESGIPDEGSSYAEEGTLAHAIAEVKLKKPQSRPTVSKRNGGLHRQLRR